MWNALVSKAGPTTLTISNMCTFIKLIIDTGIPMHVGLTTTCRLQPPLLQLSNFTEIRQGVLKLGRVLAFTIQVNKPRLHGASNAHQGRF